MPKPLSSLIHQRKANVSYFVNARMKIYQFSSEVYTPKDPYVRIDPGFESTSTHAHDAPSGLGQQKQEDIIDRSIRRTKSAIKDIALCNQFEWFATFTFRSERSDVDRCKDRMVGWLKRQKKLSSLFEYLIVPELHKDGKSLHFHALIRCYAGDVVTVKNPKTGVDLRKKGRQVYDFSSYTLGHSEVYAIGDTALDQMKTSFYLMKYVTKELPVFRNKRRYWSSRTLAKPRVIENPEEWYLMYFPDKVIEIPNGKMLYFENSRIEEHLDELNG